MIDARKAVFAVGLCSVLVGCSGGAGDFTGTWKGRTPSGNSETLQIFDDGETSMKSGNASCQGKLNTDSEPYRIKLDCGFMKGTATVELSDDGEKLKLTEAGGQNPVTLSKS